MLGVRHVRQRQGRRQLSRNLHRPNNPSFDRRQSLQMMTASRLQMKVTPQTSQLTSAVSLSDQKRLLHALKHRQRHQLQVDQQKSNGHRINQHFSLA